MRVEQLRADELRAVWGREGEGRAVGVEKLKVEQFGVEKSNS